jgi:hypothetical protein
MTRSATLSRGAAKGLYDHGGDSSWRSAAQNDIKREIL